ncbi:response regulator [Paenibacillus sonchi]|uniref:Response regulator n=1 Tax=Paenibacillus sonchi TaxID=373687 RepID=A0A974PDG6_9BACL|nr:response regulator [Paenibacillus sonchi]MCE3203307.1 response regulator [Paenibacillus sonchi]QQZ61984.1 response regulator [Paenibacillus sonchi]
MIEYKQTVLYVEDNQLNMALMHHIFKKNLPSVRLLKAETAALGLQIARQMLPDLIILDIGLPDLNGYEAMDQLKNDELTRPIPVLAISAFAQRSDIERAQKTGFSGYITKPFQVKALTEAVERLLAGIA